jgi:hypothetical protein
MAIDTPERILGSPFLAGLVGALLSLKWTPGLSMKEKVFNVLTGLAFAVFVAPAAIEWFGITSPRITSVAAFGLGLFGLSLAAQCVEGIREVKLGELISGWLRRPASKE